MNIKSYRFYYDLRSLKYVEGIWLFGSRARGTESSHSDIDLAILCPEATEEEWANIQSIVKNTQAPYSIDCVRFDTLPKDNRITQNILHDYKILFQRKPNNYPWYESFIDLGEALDQLEEMINVPESENSYVRDATIQRFEFCCELFWKTLKKICQYEKFDVNSPRSVLNKSFELGLISETSVWNSILDDRNETSHAYNLPVVEKIYHRIDHYHKNMRLSYETIQKTYNI